MKTKPYIGQSVRLNDNGLVQCFGTTIGQSHMKTLVMKITGVDAIPSDPPDRIFSVDVDNPDINIFMIDNHCFDPA